MNKHQEKELEEKIKTGFELVFKDYYKVVTYKSQWEQYPHEDYDQFERHNADFKKIFSQFKKVFKTDYDINVKDTLKTIFENHPVENLFFAPEGGLTESDELKKFDVNTFNFNYLQNILNDCKILDLKAKTSIELLFLDRIIPSFECMFKHHYIDTRMGSEKWGLNISLDRDSFKDFNRTSKIFNNMVKYFMEEYIKDSNINIEDTLIECFKKFDDNFILVFNEDIDSLNSTEFYDIVRDSLDNSFIYTQNLKKDLKNYEILKLEMQANQKTTKSNRMRII